MLLLAIPIMDTLFAILRRLINHKPLGEPDKNHLHHQLLKLKLSQKKTVIVCGSSSNIAFSPLKNTFVRLAVND